MAVPKKRTSQSRQGARRSHLALTQAPTAKCSNCGALGKPHNICANCGFYRGKQVVKVA
jgi:large subunit ribosomal protein L32